MEQNSHNRLNSYDDAIKSDATLKNHDGLENSLILFGEGGEVQDNFHEIELPSEIIYDDVRITPSFIEFKDPSEGEIFREFITIRNLGKKPAFIRILDSNSLAFKIKTLKCGKRLSPGLSLKRLISYCFKRPSLLHALIPIEINGNTIDYRIICSFSSEHIQISPDFMDFGVIDLGCSSGIKILTISNVGGKSTRFTIDLGSNDMELNIKPHRGIVRPKSIVQIHMEMIGTKEGIFFNEFWIKSTPNIRVLMKVKIIIPRLIIYHSNTTDDFTLVDFSSTFVNTKKYDTVVLKNYSFKSSNFVILAEIDDKIIPINEINLDKYGDFKVFNINPIEGKLESFQSIIFDVSFCPTAEAMSEKCLNHGQQDFMVFLRIIRVHGTEFQEIKRPERKSQAGVDEPPLLKVQIRDGSVLNSDDSLLTQLFTSSGNCQFVRLCLYGEAEIPRIKFTPNPIYLEKPQENQTICQILRAQNLSEKLPITIRFIKFGLADCSPNEKFLEPLKSTNFFIQIEGKKNRRIESPFTLVFSILIEKLISPRNINKIQEESKRYSINCIIIMKNEEKKYKKRSKFTMNKLLPQAKFPCHFLEFDENKKINKKIFINLNKNKSQFQLKFENSTKMLLTPLQIYNIKITPSVLNFGSVAVKVSDYQKLKFENKNKFSIIIRLSSVATKNIKFPFGNIIFLKPNESSIKLIEFCCDEIGKFNSYIDYIINEKHTFELSFTSNVVMKYLSIEPREIIFKSNSSSQECYQPFYSQIELKNKLNAETRFKWEIPNSANYSLEPLSGSIRGKKNLFVSINHILDRSKVNNSKAILICENGLQLTLNLNTIFSAPKVEFFNDSIDVGEIPLNLPYQVKGILYNKDYNEVMFRIDDYSLPVNGCHMYPQNGIIPPRGISIIYINLKFCTCLDFIININVIIQEITHLRFQIKGFVLFPKVKISPQTLEILRIFPSTFHIRNLIISNCGNTEVIIEFPLQDYPEFRISQSPNFDENGECEIIKIFPGKSEKISFYFKPINIGSYMFYLPININNLYGNIIQKELMEIKSKEFLKLTEHYYHNVEGIKLNESSLQIPRVLINATVIGSSLFFNKVIFKFTENQNQSKDLLEISNRSSQPITFQMKCEFLLNSPFSIIYDSGKELTKFTNEVIECSLLLEEKVTFFIEFDSSLFGSFQKTVSVFLKNNDELHLLSQIYMEGHYTGPSINCDLDKIYLEPVPLNIPSSSQFDLQLNNFRKKTKIWFSVKEVLKCTGTFNKDDLIINFLNGNVINERNVLMKVQVQFRSCSPVSFMIIVIFHDDKHEISAEVIIYGISDNSLLTIHGFLISNKKKSKNNKIELLQTNGLQSPSSLKTFGDSGICPQFDVDAFEKKLKRSFIREEPEISMLLKSDACTLSSFPSKIEKTDVTSYPCFLPGAETNYEKHLQRTMTAAERWLFSVPLKFQFYPDLDGITAVMSTLFSTNKKNMEKTDIYPIDKSFIDILISITDSGMCDHLKIKNLSENDEERVHQLLNAYDDMLTLLIDQGACLCHVSPKYLLNYSDYCLIDPKADSSMRKFEACSKLSWLDVILQSYKMFILSKIELNNENELSMIDVRNIIKISRKKNAPKNEGILLAWLEHHYERQRQKSWLNNVSEIMSTKEIEENFQPKNIVNFDSDLEDSLAFIMVTAAYCPFLINEFFLDIYASPKNPEEKLHNAICIINAWKKIRLGFIINCQEIIQPNCIQLLMLVVHLFQVLPTYLPKTKEEFTCRLSESMTHQVRLRNPTNITGALVIQFFGNDLGLFSVHQSNLIIRVNPHSTKVISIKYHARKIQKTQAYLLLCGSAIGSNFLRNQCWLLEGSINQISVINEYKMTGKLYSVSDRFLNIQIPYKFHVNYDIWMTEYEPKDPYEMKMVKWSELTMRKIPKRIFINQDYLSPMNDVHKANLSVTIAYITSNSRKCWLLFQSEYGDFCIQITTICQSSLNDSLTVQWNRAECICLSNKIIDTCPLNIDVQISSQNSQFWDCVHKIFQKGLSNREQVFWSEYINTNVGLKLIEYFIKSYDNCETMEFQHIFNKSVTYTVTLTDNMNLLSTSSTLIIHDTRKANEKTYMKLHLSASMPDVYTGILKLVSKNGFEARNYHITLETFENLAN